jgi:hypothetical protein
MSSVSVAPFIVRASSTRERTPSFWKMWRRWVSIVCVLTKRLTAISRLLNPSATR